MEKPLFLLALLAFLFTSCQKEEFTSEVVDGILTDPRDGKQYPVVELEGRLWMAADLLYETDGSRVERSYTDAPLQYYTRKYTWHSARRACPPGWRLPTSEEWTNLLLRYGGYENEQGRETGDDLNAAFDALVWDGESGLEILRGFRYWSGTSAGDQNAVSIWFFSSHKIVILSHSPKYADKSSCRCVQGAPSNGND